MVYSRLVRPDETLRPLRDIVEGLQQLDGEPIQRHATSLSSFMASQQSIIGYANAFREADRQFVHSRISASELRCSILKPAVHLDRFSFHDL